MPEKNNCGASHDVQVAQCSPTQPSLHGILYQLHTRIEFLLLSLSLNCFRMHVHMKLILVYSALDWALHLLPIRCTGKVRSHTLMGTACQEWYHVFDRYRSLYSSPLQSAA